MGKPNITKYQIQILLQEFKQTKIISLLQECCNIEISYYKRIIQSKVKDETRGKKIIPYYELGHDDTMVDDVVLRDCRVKLRVLIDNLEVIFRDWWGVAGLDNVVLDGGDDV